MTPDREIEISEIELDDGFILVVDKIIADHPEWEIDLAITEAQRHPAIEGCDY